MKRILNLLIALILVMQSIPANATRTFTDNELILGNGTASDVDYSVNVDGSDNPKLRYNHTTDKWTLSNDGTTFVDIGTSADLALKANIASPTFTGTPAAPTATAGTNTTQLATTAFVTTAVAAATDPTKISGPASATDNAIVRYDGTTGKLAQNSLATIDDSGLLNIVDIIASGNLTMSSASQTASISGLQINNSQITSTTGTNLDLQAASGNAINLKSKTTLFSTNAHVSANDAATGSNVTLTAPTTKYVRLTAVSTLASIDMIPAGNGFQELVLVNATGVPVQINNDTGGTAANRIMTGVSSPITFNSDQVVKFTYDQTRQRWLVVGGVGGGSSTSALTTLFQLIGYDVTLWSTGDDATFLNGGTISGTFAADTTTPMHGFSSYKYTQAAGSLNDYFVSPGQVVDRRFRGSKVTLTLPYTYDGANNDIQVVVYDETNATVLDSSSYIQANTQSNFSHRLSVYIPPTCTNIRVGFHTKVLNSGKIFAFDDLQMDVGIENILAYVQNSTETTSWTPTGSWIVNATYSGRWYREGAYMVGTVSITTASGGPTAASLVINLPPGYEIDTSKFANTFTGGRARVGLSYMEDSGTGSWWGTTSWFSTTSILVNAGNAAGSYLLDAPVTNSVPFAFNTSDLVIADFKVPIKGWSAANPNYLSNVDTFSTNYNALTFCSSATCTSDTVLSNQPVGTFTTYSYANSSNTRSGCTTAPTQTTSDMNTNGILLTNRVYANASTCGAPAAVAINIGKGHKGWNIKAYKSSGKATPGSIDFWRRATDEFTGMGWKEYDENTGILYMDVGFTQNDPAIAVYRFYFNDFTLQASAYIVVDASKNPALTGLNVGTVAARGTSSSGQSIPNSTVTKITYNAETFDTNSALSTDTFTAPEAGYYSVNADASFANASYGSAAIFVLSIYKGASEYKRDFEYTDGAVTQAIKLHVPALLYLNKGDTVDMRATQITGSSRTLDTSDVSFEVIKESI